MGVGRWETGASKNAGGGGGFPGEDQRYGVTTSARGPHDVGGLRGFGPVPRVEEDPVAWHMRVMRLLFALALMGLSRTSGEVRYFLETMSPQEYRDRGYYERWLVAVERLLARARASDDTKLARAAAAPQSEVLGLGNPPSPPLSPPDLGDPLAVTTVTVHSSPPPGHHRLPAYVLGRTGVVEAVYPPQQVPGSPVEDLRYEYVYNVSFTSSALWPDGRYGDEVRIDLFAGYLRPNESRR